MSFRVLLICSDYSVLYVLFIASRYVVFCFTFLYFNMTITLSTMFNTQMALSLRLKNIDNVLECLINL